MGIREEKLSIYNEGAKKVRNIKGKMNEEIRQSLSNKMIESLVSIDKYDVEGYRRKVQDILKAIK